jgi:hypothetical protein
MHIGRLEPIDWIFVTGMIRSGTTFLGTILSKPLSVDYIHEPFNGAYTLPERRRLIPQYVRAEDQSQAADRFRDSVSKLFAYRIGMQFAPNDMDSRWRKTGKFVVGSRGPFYLRLAKANMLRSSAIIKDPMAGISTEFLYREFGVKPVIIVRHPVSLAASLRRVQWFPQVHDFRLQPDLIQDYLLNDATFLQQDWSDRLLEAMAHWRLLHRMLLRQAEKYEDWVVITHEELSADPQSVFRNLYRELDLPWSPGISRKITSLTQRAGKTQPQPGRVQDFRRDSAQLFKTRRNSIPLTLRKKIFDITADVALQLYPRDSFALKSTDV